jgi:hypothetical protein
MTQPVIDVTIAPGQDAGPLFFLSVYAPPAY